MNCRGQHCTTGIRGILTGAGDGDNFPSKIILCMLGGQTHGHEATLAKAFVDIKGATMPQDKKAIDATGTEASVRKRRQTVRGACA